MARRSGSATNAPRNTLSCLTGKLTPRFVALENTSVIVELSFQGLSSSFPFCFILSFSVCGATYIILWSRKDSFITHRAFCDALVEESARFSPAIPSTNLSSTNQMMNPIQNSGSMSFSGVFGQEFGGLESENHLNLEWQKSRFPMWLDHANNAQSSRANFMVNDELAELAASQNHQWLSRRQEESFGGGVLKEDGEVEEQNKRNTTESISCSSLYYSISSGQQQTNSQAPMSATALLQKAAQLGSLNSFRNENLNKDRNSLSSTQCGMEGESSLTRDFLGVGGKENRDNFLASISSAMEMSMSRYNRNGRV